MSAYVTTVPSASLASTLSLYAQRPVTLCVPCVLQVISAQIRRPRRFVVALSTVLLVQPLRWPVPWAHIAPTQPRKSNVILAIGVQQAQQHSQDAPLAFTAVHHLRNWDAVQLTTVQQGRLRRLCVHWGIGVLPLM